MNGGHVLRLIGLFVLVLSISACVKHTTDGNSLTYNSGKNGTSHSFEVPAYEGEVERFREPIVVKPRAFPESPVWFYKSAKLNKKPEPLASGVNGVLQAKEISDGVMLIAEIAADNENEAVRRLEVRFDKAGRVVGKTPDETELKMTASLGDLFDDLFLIPIPDSGFVAGKSYGLYSNEGGELMDIHYRLRGKTDYEGRPALVFNYRAGGGSREEGIHLDGYRVMDITTGATLYQETLLNFLKIEIHSIIDMDTSGWADPADPSI